MIFEYINRGFLVFGSLSIIMIFFAMIYVSGKAKSENRKPKTPIVGFIVIASIATALILDGITTKEMIDKNIVFFQKGHELQCSTISTSYLVSKDEGWRLHKEDFTKNSLLLDAKNCDRE